MILALRPTFTLRAAALTVFAFGCGTTVGTTGTGTASTTGAGGATVTAVTTTTTTGAGGAGGQGAGGAGGDGGATVTTSTTTTAATTTTTTTGAGGAGGMDPWAGPVEALAELDLGIETFNVQHPVPIPDRTLGFTVLASASSLDKIVGIQRLRSPIGVSVILDFAMAGHSLQVFGNQGWVAGADPQSDSADAFPVKPGQWQLTLGNDGSPSAGAHVSVWVRRTEDGQFHGGKMDFNVFYPPGVSDPNYVSQVLGNLFAVSYGGITLGTVNSYSIDATYTVVDDHAEYRALVAGSSGVGTHPAINLFLVKDFADAAYGGAIGVAAGVPGAAMKSGTTLSGVAFQPSGDALYDASVLRHEIGHLGGLYHTTEFQVAETDPISDTPTCANAVITATPDQCPDKVNAMFPIAYGATAFTAGQDRVLQGSALYRGILVEGGAPALPFAVPPGPVAPPSFGKVLVRRPVKALPAGADALTRMLAAGWCTHGGSDHVGLAVRLAGAGPSGVARLRALVLDAALPERARARALAALVRASAGAPPALALAEALAVDASASSDLRAAAFAALDLHDRARAIRLARAVAASDDPIVAAVARILSKR